jgi:HSP20 family protein
LDDWLAAEREILWSPPAELTETDREFHLRIAVPGFEAKDIHVAVTPDSIQLKADAARTAADKLIFSEFGERTLFRSIALPSEIEIEKTRAVLDKGMLLFTAHKAKPAEKEIATAA